MASPVLIIPGLPDDLALLCLAWLPRRLHPLACCVSRAWRDAIQSHALLAIRHRLGTQETRLFLCLQGDDRDPHAIYTFTYSWWLLDPALCPQYDPLPSPPFPPVRFLDYDTVMVGEGEVLLAAFANCPLDADAGITTPFEEIRRLDVLRKSWRSASPPNMLTRRRSFASACLDGHIYVAGGRIWEYTVYGVDNYLETNHRVRPLKSVERLECKTMSSWERLPDMHVARVGAGAVILNGRICVIGGYDEVGRRIYSGEMWDVTSQMWVLIPELWPYHIFKNPCDPGNPRNVAVVMGTLFAIHQVYWEVRAELMVYNTACKSWTSLGVIPLESFLEDGVGRNKAYSAFCVAFSVGKELWVMVQRNGVYEGVFIIACSPLNTMPSTLSWRRLPYSFHNFIVYGGLAVTM